MSMNCAVMSCAHSNQGTVMADEFDAEVERLTVRGEILFGLRYGMSVPRDVVRAADEEHRKNRARLREIATIRESRRLLRENP